MRENFEIKKDFKFSNNIAEITSISIEEKHDVVDNILKGNFIVSGEYKIHEISLNKEKFSFKVPYEYDIRSDMDASSLNVEITDFVYESDNDGLYVTIDYDVLGDRKDILLFDDKEDLDKFLKSREVELIMDDVNNEIEEAIEKEENRESECIENKEETEIIEDNKEKEIEKFLDDIKNEPTIDEVVERNIEASMEESKEQLLNSVKVDDDNYITYKVHVVKNEDTEEAIVAKYNITKEELKEYNNYNALQLGDKLIIPLVNEE